MFGRDETPPLEKLLEGIHKATQDMAKQRAELKKVKNPVPERFYPLNKYEQPKDVKNLEDKFFASDELKNVNSDQQKKFQDEMKNLNSSLQTIFNDLVSNHPRSDAEIKKIFEDARKEFIKLAVAASTEAKSESKADAKGESKVNEALKESLEQQSKKFIDVAEKEFTKSMQRLQTSLQNQHMNHQSEALALRLRVDTEAKVWRNVMLDLEEQALIDAVNNQSKMGAEIAITTAEIAKKTKAEEDLYLHRLKKLKEAKTDETVTAVFQKEGSNVSFVFHKDGFVRPSTPAHAKWSLSIKNGLALDWKDFDAAHKELIEMVVIKSGKPQFTIVYERASDFDKKEFDRMLYLIEARNREAMSSLGNGKPVISVGPVGGALHKALYEKNEYGHFNVTEKERKAFLDRINNINKEAHEWNEMQRVSSEKSIEKLLNDIKKLSGELTISSLPILESKAEIKANLPEDLADRAAEVVAECEAEKNKANTKRHNETKEAISKLEAEYKTEFDAAVSVIEFDFGNSKAELERKGKEELDAKLKDYHAWAEESKTEHGLREEQIRVLIDEHNDGVSSDLRGLEAEKNQKIEAIRQEHDQKFDDKARPQDAYFTEVYKEKVEELERMKEEKGLLLASSIDQVTKELVAAIDYKPTGETKPVALREEGEPLAVTHAREKFEKVLQAGLDIVRHKLAKIKEAQKVLATKLADVGGNYEHLPDAAKKMAAEMNNQLVDVEKRLNLVSDQNLKALSVPGEGRVNFLTLVDVVKNELKDARQELKGVMDSKRELEEDKESHKGLGKT